MLSYVRVEEGDTGVLRCPVPDSEHMSVSWTKGDYAVSAFIRPRGCKAIWDLGCRISDCNRKTDVIPLKLLTNNE